MSQNLADLKKKRGYQFASITRSSKQVTPILELSTSDVTVDHLTTVKAVLESITEKTSLINTLNDEIIQQADENEIEAELELIDKKDFEFRKLKKQLEHIIDSFNQTQNEGSESNHSVGVSSHLKLPKLDLPKFDGNYQNWTPFFDLFNGSVDSNDGLPEIQKLHYLKSSLKGEPAKLLSHLPITSANYKVAVKLVKERYENKRLISRAHINAILNFKPLNQESAEGIRSLVNCFVENTMALNELVKEEDQLSCFLVRVLSQKLDYPTRRQWELNSTGDEIQTMNHFKTFLEARANALEATGKSTRNSNQDKTSQEKPVQNYHSGIQSCPQCKASHKLFMCDHFKQLSITEKRDKVKILKVCFNCLRLGHQTKDCKSKNTCQKCQKKHHTMLHDDSIRKTSEKVQSNLSTKWGDSFCTLLPTAMVNVISSDNSIISCRALLDSGSQSSFITESCAQLLNLKRKKQMLHLTGIGDRKQRTPTASTQFQIKSTIDSNKIFNVRAFILPRLASTMPSVQNPERIVVPSEVSPLADTDYLNPSEIDLILGADIFEDVVLDEKIKTSNGLYFRKTEFGWVASGQTSSRTNHPTQSYHVTSEFNLKNFWELEQIPTQSKLTKEEIACEEHFRATTTQDDNGRFIVKLPFKKESPKLGESLQQAQRRFFSLEKRLQSMPNTKTKYKEFIQEFRDLGHLELVPNADLEKPCDQVFYLPHHSVIKEDSTTTKLRVVFDGSAKSQSGISLNESLMVGSTIQPDLFSTLMRFRFHRVAISGDVAKMYRQVGLDTNDRDFHRILWRDNPTEPLQHLRMTRVTYGIASSAFHATRCLKQVAELCGETLFVSSIQNDFYVDDFLSGASSTAEAKLLLLGVSEELRKHGFELRKWTSSDPEITLDLPTHLRETAEKDKILDNDYQIKTLGVKWKPNLDVFTFEVLLELTAYTKRTFLSDLSKLFDPLGWLAPIITRYKVLMQEIWTTGIQ